MRTLQDHTYYTKATVGFSTDVDKQIMEDARIMSCTEREKYVTIIMNEMHLRGFGYKQAHRYINFAIICS